MAKPEDMRKRLFLNNAGTHLASSRARGLSARPSSLPRIISRQNCQAQQDDGGDRGDPPGFPFVNARPWTTHASRRHLHAVSSCKINVSPYLPRSLPPKNQTGTSVDRLHASQFANICLVPFFAPQRFTALPRDCTTLLSSFHTLPRSAFRLSLHTLLRSS